MINYKKIEKSIDTIIWSLPFKRLGGKTQIYRKGLQDHHRDRLTHTIEVMNLSEQLANKIKKNKKKDQSINLGLCKAIALAHDLGHTPFGHAGEEALHLALSYIQGCKKIKGLQGFTHNEQGLDVVTYMYSWNTTNDGDGLFKDNNKNEIGKAICNGIIQHTFDLKNNKKVYLSLKYLIDKTKYTDIINNRKRELSPEAQIVRICDKISYMISDIEDGFMGGAITISEIKNKISGKLFDGLKKESYDLSEHRSFLRYREDLIDKLIDDCVQNKDNQIDVSEFKDSMNDVYNKIQKGILFKNNYIKINNDKGKLIVSCLFCQYLRNPELIGSQFFRYKYHNQKEVHKKADANIVSYYSKIQDYYKISTIETVNINICEWLKSNNCIDSDVDKIFERNIVDVICVKDWVASLTDSYAEKCYREHVNCRKSKEKWNSLDNVIR